MRFVSLAPRRCQPEIMDQPGLDPTRHAQALRGLARINRISASDRILWRPLSTLLRASPGRPIRVLDLATGGGDVPIRLWQRARRAGLALEVHGVDASATAIAHARAAARRTGAAVGFATLDVLREPLPAGFDVLTASLFLHHLDETQAVALLRHMGQAARRMVLVNDLVALAARLPGGVARHALPLALAHRTRRWPALRRGRLHHRGSATARGIGRARAGDRRLALAVAFSPVLGAPCSSGTLIHAKLHQSKQRFRVRISVD